MAIREMKKYILIAVAVITALSSCSKFNGLADKETNGKSPVFTASMENIDGTRATFNSTDRIAEWEIGDQISVAAFNSGVFIGEANFIAQTKGSTTTFKAVTPGTELTGDWYSAISPSSLSVGSLPAEITEDYGKFNMPMSAESLTTELEFYNICGVLAVTVKNDEKGLASVKSIKVSSKNLGVSGKFYATSNNNNPPYAELENPSEDPSSHTLTITYTEAVTTGDDGKVFYAAIPPSPSPSLNPESQDIPYQELKIEVSDGVNTKSMTTREGYGITIERNKIYPITFAGN